MNTFYILARKRERKGKRRKKFIAVCCCVQAPHHREDHSEMLPTSPQKTMFGCRMTPHTSSKRHSRRLLTK